MALYTIGSQGDEVKKIQEKLKADGYYRGPLDGIYGGGTDAAVMSFQQTKGLVVDGKVGPVSWKALFNEDIAEPTIISKPLTYRSLALTGSFETNLGIGDCFAGLSGDFDGQGLSFGVCQWNFGQNTLQPLVRDMIHQHPDTIKAIFRTNFDVLVQALNSDKQDLMTFIRSIQDPVKHAIYEPWKGMFKSLGRTEEFQSIEFDYANRIFQSSQKLCLDYGLWSERALALMFDICVQNGSISNLVKAQIMSDFDQLTKDLAANDLEVQKMQIIANRRASAANPRWVEDVRARKLCIANGEGVVHNIRYNLDDQFGIGLRRTQA